MLHAARGLLTPGAYGTPLVIDDLDDLDNVYGAYSLKLIRAAYSGDLARLRRVSDNVEDDFGPDGTGWIDAAAITTWLGGSSARVVTMYDQSGNSRPFSQSTAADQPVLDLSGSHPRLYLDASTDEFFDMDASGLGWVRNTSVWSLIQVAAIDAFPANNTTIFFSSGTTVTRVRSMLRTSNAGVLNAPIQTIDTDDTNSSFGGGPTLTATQWYTQQLRVNLAGGTKRIRADGTSVDVALSVAHPTADTDSQRGRWGDASGAPTAYVTTLVLLRDLLTDAEMDAVAAFGAGLKAP
jgi:hypothetical protein